MENVGKGPFWCGKALAKYGRHARQGRELLFRGGKRGNGGLLEGRVGEVAAEVEGGVGGGEGERAEAGDAFEVDVEEGGGGLKGDNECVTMLEERQKWCRNVSKMGQKWVEMCQK